MKIRVPQRADLGFLCTIILAVVLIMPRPLPYSRGLLVQTVSIQDALKSGQVEAWAESLGMGFRQPMMLLHIESKKERAVTIRIPRGTRIVSTNPQFSDLVVASNLEVHPTPRVDVPVNAFSLIFKLSLPSVTKNISYSIGEVVTGKLVGLLKAIDDRKGYERYGAQLAIWSLYQDPEIPLEQMTQKIQVNPVDIQDADQWLMLAKTANPADRSHLGLVLIAIIVFAVIIAAGFTMRDVLRWRQSSAAKPSDPAQPVNQPDISRKTMDKKENITRPHPGVTSEKEAKNQPHGDGGPLVRLRGISGKSEELEFNLDLPCLISRGEVEWLTLEDGAVSTPHALFDFSNSPFRVKDLNSLNGLRMGEQQVELFTDIYLGDKLSIGKQTLVVDKDGMKIIAGSLAGKRFTFTSELVGFTQENFRVVVLGSDDMRISDAHAILKEENGTVTIKDLRSSNGTRLNGQTLETETQLKNGDHLMIGDSEYEILIPSLGS
jgi:pSer/pThr/pTyr-binding forkhead associated (FHA) protein